MNPIIFLTPIALLILSVVLSVILVKKGVKVKRALAVHFLSLIVIVALSLVLPMAASAAGEPDGAPAASDTVAPAADANDGMKYIGAALAVGLAGIGGGIAVAAGSSAAIGATAEDPKYFGKSIVFVALGEGFGLYGLLVAFLILFV